MALRDLIPWKREATPARRGAEIENVDGDPFEDWNHAVDRMFTDFWGERERGLSPWGVRWGAFDPKVDIVETEDQVKVEAELPGLDPDDVQVSVSRNVLSIRGEKKHERKEQGENWTRSERSYGSFERAIRLPQDTDAEQVDASFDKGVLTITFGKKVTDRKRIAVQTHQR